jgi:sulfur-carrier protein adenylyltransferase/sulfurtransferase
LTADGPVELNMDIITGNETPTQIIRIAYGMEQSVGDFYRLVKEQIEDAGVKELLTSLAQIEERHKDYLFGLYTAADPFPTDKTAFEAEVETAVMEGGFSAGEFMSKNAKFLTSVANVLDLSMMLEAQALDLYMRFAQKAENSETKDILHKIGEEEKIHLESLGRLRDKIG